MVCILPQAKHTAVEYKFNFKKQIIMKKSLVILATGMLAGGTLYAAEANVVSLNTAEEQSMIQDVDFSTLDFAKVEVESLPERVARTLDQLEESGLELKEAAVAKTAEGVAIFRLSTAKLGEESLIYVSEDGAVLKTIVKKQQEEEAPVEE